MVPWRQEKKDISYIDDSSLNPPLCKCDKNCIPGLGLDLELVSTRSILPSHRGSHIQEKQQSFFLVNLIRDS